MATSGTTLFEPELDDLIEEAASRAGFELRSGYDMQSAVRSMNLLLTDMANRGLNLFTITEGTVSLIAGTGQYNLPADTVDVVHHMVAQGSTDYHVERIGVGTWGNISNKTQTGRPFQAWIDRRRDSPVVNFWPVPDQAYTYKYWRMRRLQDAGLPHNTIDAPFRFWPALTSGLAYYLSMKGSDQNRTQFLQGVFEQDLMRAQNEDRGRESFYVGVSYR